MKKLRIAQIAPPWIEVPPKKYGGTELIVSYLTEELIKKGHDVTLFASGTSKTQAKLVSAFPKALYWKGISWADSYYSLFHALTAFERAEDFDIIHNHYGYFGLCFSHLVKTPMVTTYHGDFALAEKNFGKYKILKKLRHLPFVSISNSQRKFSSLKLNFVTTIYNGIDVEKFQFNAKPGKYLTWLGRITPKKGLLGAIKVAKKLNLPLKIAAKIDKNCSSDVEFYEKEIKPLIDGKKIIFLGEIEGYREKSNFLKNSLALLNPITWNEPFGLVMIEAMACGTPVIVFNQGSAKEVVEDGKTGFVVKNINEMVRAVKKIDRISRKACRQRVEKHFTYQEMVSSYEKIYYKILRIKKERKK